MKHLKKAGVLLLLAGVLGIYGGTKTYLSHAGYIKKLPKEVSESVHLEDNLRMAKYELERPLDSKDYNQSLQEKQDILKEYDALKKEYGALMKNKEIIQGKKELNQCLWGESAGITLFCASLVCAGAGIYFIKYKTKS